MYSNENREGEQVEENQLGQVDDIQEYGQTNLEKNKRNKKIHLLNIIGEIEGHDCLASTTKTTKYEHVIPKLAEVEDDEEIEGLLIILNTVGGDVECGLALAELVASMEKPTVSLVLGGSHSIGVPLAVSTDYSFIVPTGTMVIHPVRMNGLFIGVPQTYEYFKKIQQRINYFVTNHCGISEERYTELMMETEVMTKDVGSILVGRETVDEHIIDEIGGLKEAVKKLYELIDEKSKY